MKFKQSDILSVDQFDRDNVEQLFILAHRMEGIADRKVRCQVLDGYILGSLFFEPSTRTCLSFNAAMLRLGGLVNSTVGFEFSSMAKGETLADTITVAQEYCDLFVIRHPRESSAVLAAEYSRKPVINAGDGSGEHPTQALLDLFTILEERGKVDGLTIAMIGDLKNGRTVHSLAKLLTLYKDIHFVFIAPDTIQMPANLTSQLMAAGSKVTKTADFQWGVENAHVIYMTRIQKERFESSNEYQKVNDIYVLNAEFLQNNCQPSVVVMHPLPRLNEISTDVDNLTCAAYFRQAKNGVLIRMALFLLVLGKENKFV